MRAYYSQLLESVYIVYSEGENIENAKASEIRLTEDVIHRIDEILVDVVEHDR
jgi:hypothetical protein